MVVERMIMGGNEFKGNGLLVEYATLVADLLSFKWASKTKALTGGLCSPISPILILNSPLSN